MPQPSSGSHGAHAAQHAGSLGDRAGRDLERAADLFERDRVRLMAVMVREAARQWRMRWRRARAIDFLRY